MILELICYKSLIKLNLSNNYRDIVRFPPRVIPVCLSRVLGERTVIVLPIAQLFSRASEAVRCLCLRHHRLIRPPVCFVQTQQYVLVEEVIKDAISSEHDYIFVLHDMGVDIGVGGGFIVCATLIRVVKTVLLLFGSEHDIKFV